MSETDWRNLYWLIVAFINKEPVRGLKEDLHPVSCIEVGKLRFIVTLEKCEEAGTYEMHDFFKEDFLFVPENSGNEKFPVSQFYILQRNELLTLDNICSKNSNSSQSA